MRAHSLDPDTRAVAEHLTESVRTSGMTAAEFAETLGTSASRFSTYRTGRTRPTAQFCFRARRIADALAAARARRVMTAPDTAAAIRDAEDEEWAWRLLLQGRDHLRLILAEHDDLTAAWEAAPTRTGEPGFDALLALLARQEFEAAAVEPPVWTRPEPLPQPWAPEHPFLTREEVVRRTPRELAALNVFVPGRDLVTA